jgi:hypothetical protein
MFHWRELEDLSRDHNFDLWPKQRRISHFRPFQSGNISKVLETRGGRALAPVEVTGKGSGGFRTRLTDGAHAQM